MAAKTFQTNFNVQDPKYKTVLSHYSSKRVKNTPRQRYSDQLRDGMHMYHACSDSETGVLMRGSLVIICRDAIIEYTFNERYVADTGVNLPSKVLGSRRFR